MARAYRRARAHPAILVAIVVLSTACSQHREPEMARGQEASCSTPIKDGLALKPRQLLARADSRALRAGRSQFGDLHGSGRG